MSTTNLERLKMETKGIDYPDSELSIYLAESGLSPDAEYDPSSAATKRAIYETALSVLESLANQPQLMKNYKSDDQSVTDFHDNLQARIDQLERKIRMMAVNDNEYGNSNTFMLFGN